MSVSYLSSHILCNVYVTITLNIVIYITIASTSYTFEKRLIMIKDTFYPSVDGKEIVNDNRP